MASAGLGGRAGGRAHHRPVPAAEQPSQVREATRQSQEALRLLSPPRRGQARRARAGARARRVARGTGATQDAARRDGCGAAPGGRGRGLPEESGGGAAARPRVGAGRLWACGDTVWRMRLLCIILLLGAEGRSKASVGASRLCSPPTGLRGCAPWGGSRPRLRAPPPAAPRAGRETSAPSSGGAKARPDHRRDRVPTELASDAESRDARGVRALTRSASRREARFRASSPTPRKGPRERAGASGASPAALGPRRDAHHNLARGARAAFARLVRRAQLLERKEPLNLKCYRYATGSSVSQAVLGEDTFSSVQFSSVSQAAF